MSKKILIIGINYYPEDSAIGLYTTQKAEYLVEKGFDVTVITGFPYYPQWEIYDNYKSKPFFLKEIINGVKIFRSWQYVPKSPTFFKRVIHLISFAFGNFINLFRASKPDIVISIIPFTTSALLGWFLKIRYRSKLLIHIQDFEFDAAIESGIVKDQNIINSLLFKLERFLFSKADLVSTISFSMLDKLKQKTKTKTNYFPNWVEENYIDPETRKQHKYIDKNKFNILYSGNIGEKQDWKIFFEVAKKLKKYSDIKFIVVGAGAKEEWVKAKTKSIPNIKMYNPVPYDELSNLLCSTDLHILFQKASVVDTVMPSKILGMMASAKPSIITGNKDSEVFKIVKESNLGYFINENNPDLIIEKIFELYNNPDLRLKMGNLARSYVLKNFSKSKILSKFLFEMNSLNL